MMATLTEKKQTPLLFKPYMVNAVLAEMKLQTRRLNGLEIVNKDPNAWDYDGRVFINKQPQDGKIQTVIPVCPYGKPGDLLWGRENFQHSNFPYGPMDKDCHFFYMADFLDDPLGVNLEHSGDGIRRTWKPSIHMPKYACRLWLEIRKVRIERLLDITDGDAVLEGTYIDIHPHRRLADGPQIGKRSVDGSKVYVKPGVPRRDFLTLFASINGQALVDANPWVWVISFEHTDLDVFEKIDLGVSA